MTESHEAHHDHSPVVLLIDDSEFVHRLLKARLKTESIHIVSEFDGRSGINRAIADLPSLILLDLDMPGMDEVGWRACTDRHNINIPVVS